MEQFKGFTKTKQNATLYGSPNGYQAKVYDSGKETLIISPEGGKWLLSELSEHRKEEIKPLMAFIEASINNKFTPPEDELE